MKDEMEFRSIEQVHLNRTIEEEEQNFKKIIRLNSQKKKLGNSIVLATKREKSGRFRKRGAHGLVVVCSGQLPQLFGC